MYGVRRPSSSKTAPAVYTCYHCPYRPSNPRHAAAHPDHQAHSVSIREETIVAAITGFLDQYVFSHDRAAQLAGLTAAAVPDQDPALLDALPYLTSQPDDAPAHLVAALLDALDTTPATITALFSDPRAAASVPSPRPPAETSTPGLISDSAPGPIPDT
jgi:hypothetical protein